MAADRQDLLEFIYSGRGRFVTVRATIREWLDPEIVDKVLKRFGTTDLYRETFGHQEPPSLKNLRHEGFERIRKVWHERPDRWRQEIVREDDKGTEYKVADGKAFWHYSPTAGARRATTTEGKFGSDFEIAHVFDPRSMESVLEELDMRAVEQVQQAGRQAFKVNATVRGKWTQLPDPLWWGADDYELVVDAEYGAILRLSSRLKGLDFDVTEVLEVGFDDAFTESTFVLDLPGVEFSTIDRL